MDIAAVIVNYETDDEARDLARDIETVCSAVVIVDNSAPSPGLETWADDRAKITYLNARRNIGYAAGNNRGIEHISESCDCYCILNPDVRLPSANALTTLAEKLFADPELGILAPAIGDEPASNQHIDSAAARLLHRLDLLPPLSARSNGLIPRTQVIGCALLLDADMVAEIGGFAEEFFLYVEEIEYCYRARERGYSVAFDPTTVVYHDEPQSGFSHPELYQTYYRTRNVFVLARRRFSGAAKVGYLSTIFVILVAFLLNKEIHLIRPWFRGVVDGVLGKTGRGPYP